MENENIFQIDILEIFSILLSKLWLIVITGAITACAFFSYAFYLVEPKYESSTMFYVNNNNLNIGSVSYSISSSDISASQSLVNTYIIILKTRNTLETVIEKAQLDYSYGQLLGMISASQVDETEIFRVNVRSGDPKEACIIANTIASVLPDKISSIVTGSGAKIVDYGIVSTNIVSPSLPRYILVGFVVGAAIISIIIVLLYYLDDIIRGEEDLPHGDLPLLAAIPNLNNKHESSYYYKNYYYYGRYGKNKTK